jgi:hypothetical protein
MEKEILKAKLSEMYWDQGKGLKMIAKEVGTSYASIQRLFNSLEIPRRGFTTKGLHPNVGRICSDETKERISAKHRGKKLSPEHREKVVSALDRWRSVYGAPKLENHPCWKGGKIYRDGYVLMRNPNHPQAYKNGYVKRAILIAEEKLGRSLLEGEVTHHVNHIKDDDRPENIEVFSSHSEHTSLHNDLKTKEILSRVEIALEKES